MTTYAPYAPRRIITRRLATFGETRLKNYVVLFEGEFDRTRFTGVREHVAEALPPVDVAGGRPGVGFLILHQGRGVDYTVLGWWDRENELPIRVWVRDAGGWRAARGGESACVWDLEIIWHERRAWVATALDGRPIAEALEDYLRLTFS